MECIRKGLCKGGSTQGSGVSLSVIFQARNESMSAARTAARGSCQIPLGHKVIDCAGGQQECLYVAFEDFAPEVRWTASSSCPYDSD